MSKEQLKGLRDRIYHTARSTSMITGADFDPSVDALIEAVRSESKAEIERLNRVVEQARNDALEEAAAICDRNAGWAKPDGYSGQLETAVDEGKVSAYESSAQDIRALKETP